MADTPNSQQEESNGVNSIVIGSIILLITLGLALVIGAVLLALNAEAAAPGVEIIRDLMIIVLALLLALVGTAIVVLLIQIARLVNLLNNEVQPLIQAASDTINTVRGTATFLSNNLVEPVMAVNSAVKGVTRMAQDADAIRQAAGILMSAATGAHTSASPVVEEISDAEKQIKAGDETGSTGSEESIGVASEQSEHDNSTNGNVKVKGEANQPSQDCESIGEDKDGKR